MSLVAYEPVTGLAILDPRRIAAVNEVVERMLADAPGCPRCSTTRPLRNVASPGFVRLGCSFCGWSEGNRT